MAELSVHDKEAKDKVFLEFLPLIVDGASDKRNFVKKAVNWSLRQIGKRNPNLNRASISAAGKIHGLDSSAAKWIASDALRELKSPVLSSLRLLVDSACSHRLWGLPSSSGSPSQLHLRALSPLLRQ